MSAFTEKLDEARQSEAEIEALLDVAKRDASAGKYGAVQEADRLQAILDATHDPVAEERLLDALVAEGILDEDGERLYPDDAPEDEVDEDPVPDGNIDEVLAWVHGGKPGEEPTDGWQDRARKALGVEDQAGEHARKGIVEPLTRALQDDADAAQDGADGPGAGADGSTGPTGAPQA